MTREQLLGVSRLTPRWVDVLTAYANGMTRKEAAAHLHLSESTVATYIEKARDCLHARNTAHAVAIAVAAGVVTVGEPE